MVAKCSSSCHQVGTKLSTIGNQAIAKINNSFTKTVILRTIVIKMLRVTFTHLFHVCRMEWSSSSSHTKQDLIDLESCSWFKYQCFKLHIRDIATESFHDLEAVPLKNNEVLSLEIHTSYRVVVTTAKWKGDTPSRGDRRQRKWTGFNLELWVGGQREYTVSSWRGSALKPLLAGSEVSGRVDQCPGKYTFMLKAEPQKGLAIWFRDLLADCPAMSFVFVC